MTTALKTIFEKPVDRNIEGVIKADAEDALSTEVQEYVITRELESRLESFLDAYNNYENANGVWISGFFGSGKSHLLKMLALLLEKRPIEGCDIRQEFLQKANLLNNPILAGALEKACEIPSESILFNIDQKADVISKQQLDALMAVFVKVFDEHCGYYGKQPYIAQFERLLDEDGLLDRFREAFESLAGNTWEWGRTRINRVSDHVDAAHHEVTGSSKTGVIETFRNDYRLSIEDFAQHVKNYIDRKPKGFRLNFFVDEVGQFIAENVKLMTNLQTVAESLATKCKGQAWVIVTAQNDMNTIVGDMDKQQGNDFSKIQARFRERMSLSSQDVAEVIQKRLLKKKREYEEAVGVIYDDQQNNFNTLLSFADGSQTYRNFRDREHFINCYPFIPYQFELFQKAIRALSDQNAFEGRHQSVGERSMLGVFQDVAKQIKDKDLGSLATFDLMFEGLRSSLKTQVHAAIGTAEKNLDNKLAIQVLKALFLVKYVQEFKPTIHNLCVLMLDRFDRNLNEFKKEVTEAVNLLDRQTYVKRNGETYEFLTNEEKDVEQEIRNTEVDSQELGDELHRLLSSVISLQKMRYEDNGKDYPYTHRVDGKNYGREQELALHIVTPFHENAERIDQLKMESMGASELLVVLPPDDRVIRDLQLIKQTERYVKRNSQTQKTSLKKILMENQSRNQQRTQELKQHLKDLLGKSRLFVAGEELEISSEDVQTRLLTGFGRLISSEYTNLKMLQGIDYSEKQIATIIHDKQGDLYGTGMATMSEAENEMFSYITRTSGRGIRSTVESVVQHFERAPNGWYLAAIQCVLAKLCSRGKIEARSDGEILADDHLVDAITKTRRHANVILEPQVDIPSSQIRDLKNFYHDFFNEPAPAGEALELGKHVAKRFQEVTDELNELLRQQSTYAFLSELQPLKKEIDQLAKKKGREYFTDVKDFEDTLLDMKETTLDPIREFMSGSMADIYVDAQEFLQTQKANLDHLQSTTTQRIREALENSRCFAGSVMQSVKSDLSEVRQTTAQKVAEEKAQAKEVVEALRGKLTSVEQFQQLDETQQAEVLGAFDGCLQSIDQAELIAVIRDKQRSFREYEYPTLLQKLANPPYNGEPDENDDSDQLPKVRIVNASQLQTGYSKPWVKDSTDLDEYLQALREAMTEQLEHGHHIHI